MPTPVARTEPEFQYPLYETDPLKLASVELDPSELAKPHRHRIVWRNVWGMIFLHLGACYGFYLAPYAEVKTLCYIWCLGLLSSWGVQAGAHRLWCHRAYKASFGLRVFLMLCQTLALQNDIYEWARDHRAHHRFSDTDADPHNSSRGFFFSHMGWLLVKKHPDVIRRGKTINMEDLKADPIVMFQRRFYIPLVLIFWGIIPITIPYYFWGEPIFECIFGCIFSRYVLTLHITWLVNSWSHLYGTRPYDKNIAPVESSIRHLLMGEGFHNFHHAFPWDYSASELGPLDVFNPCTAMINCCAFLGLAWDLKKVNPNVVAKKVDSTGNPLLKYKKGSTLWEWSMGLLLGMFSTLIFFLAIHYTFKGSVNKDWRGVFGVPCWRLEREGLLTPDSVCY